MFQQCDVCGIKFSDEKSLEAHSKNTHAVTYNSARPAIQVPVIGDGSTGLRGTQNVLPVRTSNRTQEEIIAHLEDSLGIHNFHGYTIRPLKEPTQTVRQAAKKLVKVAREEAFENAYVSFYKNLGVFEFEKNALGR